MYIYDNLDKFNKIIIDLEREDLKINVDDENQTLIIINSLLKSHVTLVETIKNPWC